MPSIQLTEVMKYEFEWEDLDRPNPNLDSVLASVVRTRAVLVARSKADRPISGNKRAAQFREKQGYKAPAQSEGQVQLMQSITATPALKNTSFEELRVECYNQSAVAKGRPPAPVDAVANPYDVIPPMFNAFKDAKEDEYANDFVMQG